jgi:Flp pilus assembly pilin Flp
MNMHETPARSSWKKKSGQGMTEYIIVIAIVAIGAILIIGVFGKQIKNTFARISTALSGESKGAAAPDVADADAQDDLGDFDADVSQ